VLILLGLGNLAVAIVSLAVEPFEILAILDLNGAEIAMLILGQ